MIEALQRRGRDRCDVSASHQGSAMRISASPPESALELRSGTYTAKRVTLQKQDWGRIGRLCLPSVIAQG
jgi:hypothetical protein